MAKRKEPLDKRGPRSFPPVQQIAGKRCVGGEEYAFVGQLGWTVAGVFAYPSRLEGFGFQAMVCAAPVAATNASSLRSDLAGAASLAAPENFEAITAVMERMLTHERWRTQRVAAGIARAASFAWTSSRVRPRTAITKLSEALLITKILNAALWYVALGYVLALVLPGLMQPVAAFDEPLPWVSAQQIRRGLVPHVGFWTPYPPLMFSGLRQTRSHC
jgi:hypothetical protein